MDRVIVFGGAFNPPHNLHFLLAEEVANNFDNVYKVVFVPVNSKYQKKEALLSNEHRYNMLKLVCDKNNKFEVSNIELESDRPLYTIETLNILKKQYPDKEIIFLTGTDNLKEFDTWHEPEQILQNFKVLVLERDNDTVKDIIALNPFLNANKDRFLTFNQKNRSNLSSTSIRERIRNDEDIKELVPIEIYEYIKKNNEQICKYW